MNLLNLVAKEFISIVEILEETEPIENDRIILERDYFRTLLEKYQYMKFRNKAKIYKALNFIIHDKNNYTMPYKDKEKNKTVRKVIINYSTYQTIRDLYETKVE